MTLVRQVLPLVIWIGSLSAQTNAQKGRIIGVVLDPSGASIAEADVTLVNDTTGVVRELRSNKTGQYQSSSIDPGSYTIRVETEGFARASIEAVLVSVGTTVPRGCHAPDRGRRCRISTSRRR